MSSQINDKTVLPDEYIPAASHIVIETPPEIKVTGSGVQLSSGSKFRVRKLMVYAVGENVSGVKVGDCIDLNLREMTDTGKVPSHVVEIKPYFSVSQIHVNFVAGKRVGLALSYEDTKTYFEKELGLAGNSAKGNSKSNLIERV
jgi:hypothetical protein